MSSMYYTVYMKDIISLCRSLVIKCDFAAQVMNAQLLSRNVVVDSSDPKTWKYYLNMAGRYHSTDMPMQVRSMDTLEMIDFTLENLQIHRATARNYKPGTVYYKFLVAKYPSQADLIKGIIFPVDIQKAIDSDNGDILYYDPQYVEENEDTFINDLQGFIHAYFVRWLNEQYLMIDDLYLQTFWGQMFHHVVCAIKLLRLRNARTSMAHSFHIRQYLASNGRLDEYIPYLTRSSLMWLYRNLRWVQRNVGKQETFNRLVDNILTPRNIPVLEYTLIQNVEGMPESLYPTVELERRDINMKTIQEGQEKSSVALVLERQARIARENSVVQGQAEVDIIDAVRSQAYSSLPTKILDSEVIDRSNSSMRTLDHILINEWLYLAASGKYRAYINVTNPLTGVAMSMTVKDAFIVMFYAFQKTRGLELTSIPQIIAYDVLRPKLPTYPELAGIVNQAYIPKGMIQAIMDRVTPFNDSYISTEQFYLDCERQHAEYKKLWMLYSFQEHYRTRGGGQQLVDRHYMHIKCRLVDGVQSFEDYLGNAGFDILDLNMADLDQLMLDCINVATGSNLFNRLSISTIQKYLLKMMSQLSSYSVQFLRNTTYSDFHFLGIPSTRFGDLGAMIKSHDHINIPLVDVTKFKGLHRQGVDLTQKDIMPEISVGVRESQQTIPIDATVPIRLVNDSFSRFRLNVLDITARRFKYKPLQTPDDSGDLPYYEPSTDPAWPKL